MRKIQKNLFIIYCIWKNVHIENKLQHVIPQKRAFKCFKYFLRPRGHPVVIVKISYRKNFSAHSGHRKIHRNTSKNPQATQLFTKLSYL